MNISRTAEDLFGEQHKLRIRDRQF